MGRASSRTKAGQASGERCRGDPRRARRARKALVIVFDAAAVIDLSLEVGDRGEWVAERFRSAGSARAPHVIDLEVASTLRRLTLLSVISARRARMVLQDFLDLPIRRYPSTRLLQRVFELRGNLTAYDAAYVALAEALGATLVTTDERLARSTGHTATIVSPT